MARGKFALLWIFHKNCIVNSSLKSQKRQRLITFILVNTRQYPRTMKNNIYHSNKRVPPPFHSDTNPVFGYVLIHSFRTNHVLAVTVELIWLLLLNILSFNFVPTANKFMLDWQDSKNKKNKNKKKTKSNTSSYYRKNQFLTFQENSLWFLKMRDYNGWV